MGRPGRQGIVGRGGRGGLVGQERRQGQRAEAGAARRRNSRRLGNSRGIAVDHARSLPARAMLLSIEVDKFVLHEDH